MERIGLGGCRWRWVEAWKVDLQREMALNDIAIGPNGGIYVFELLYYYLAIFGLNLKGKIAPRCKFGSLLLLR